MYYCISQKRPIPNSPKSISVLLDFTEETNSLSMDAFTILVVIREATEPMNVRSPNKTNNEAIKEPCVRTKQPFLVCGKQMEILGHYELQCTPRHDGAYFWQ